MRCDTIRSSRSLSGSYGQLCPAHENAYDILRLHEHPRASTSIGRSGTLRPTVWACSMRRRQISRDSRTMQKGNWRTVEELLKQSQWLAIVRDNLNRVPVRIGAPHRCVSLRAAQRRHHPGYPLAGASEAHACWRPKITTAQYHAEASLRVVLKRLHYVRSYNPSLSITQRLHFVWSSEASLFLVLYNLRSVSRHPRPFMSVHVFP
jgi:hypothetical protein